MFTPLIPAFVRQSLSLRSAWLTEPVLGYTEKPCLENTYRERGWGKGGKRGKVRKGRELEQASCFSHGRWLSRKSMTLLSSGVLVSGSLSTAVWLVEGC